VWNKNILIVIRKIHKNAIRNIHWCFAVLARFYKKRISNVNACLRKETARKFSKSLRLSVAVLPRKGLIDAFSFETSRRQQNTVSRATCAPRATGWAQLPYDVNRASFIFGRARCLYDLDPKFCNQVVTFSPHQVT